MASAVLSEAHLAKLAEHGEERSAEIGDVLFTVGDAEYPFIAIRDGGVALMDQTGKELVRHRAFGFVGELNLLTGQSSFLTAVVTEPLRYVAVDRLALRALLFEDSTLADLLLPAFMRRRELLQRQADIGLEITGPRSSSSTRSVVDYVRRARFPARSVGKPARHGGSRIISASRPASAAASSPAAP